MLIKPRPAKIVAKIKPSAIKKHIEKFNSAKGVTFFTVFQGTEPLAVFEKKGHAERYIAANS